MELCWLRQVKKSGDLTYDKNLRVGDETQPFDENNFCFYA